jgi:type I restriction enzyme R subunit
VTEYNHERAVADGVNVGYDVYRIRTAVTEEGGKVEKGLWIDKRSRETRKKRWEQLDDDLEYSAQQLDRSVVVPSQIRTVLKAFKDALESDLFPGREMVPKTLVFAKDDSHAEDIVHIVREVFGKGNDFAKKITYQSKNAETGKAAKGEELIQQFRTSPQLRIAVTLNMIVLITHESTNLSHVQCHLQFYKKDNYCEIKAALTLVYGRPCPQDILS